MREVNDVERALKEIRISDNEKQPTTDIMHAKNLTWKVSACYGTGMCVCVWEREKEWEREREREREKEREIGNGHFCLVLGRHLTALNDTDCRRTLVVSLSLLFSFHPFQSSLFPSHSFLFILDFTFNSHLSVYLSVLNYTSFLLRFSNLSVVYFSTFLSSLFFFLSIPFLVCPHAKAEINVRCKTVCWALSFHSLSRFPSSLNQFFCRILSFEHKRKIFYEVMTNRWCLDVYKCTLNICCFVDETSLKAFDCKNTRQKFAKTKQKS